MTTNDIDAIRSRAYLCAARRDRWASEVGKDDQDVIDDLRRAKELAVDNVPALCDEVEQLRAQVMQFAGQLGSVHGKRTVLRGRLHDTETELEKVRAQLTAAVQSVKDRYEQIARLELLVTDLEKQCNEQMHQLAERARTQETHQ